VRRLLLILATFSSLAAVSCLTSGCDDLVCGEGTHEEDGVCLANILTGCAAGTVYDKGWCVPVAPDSSTADAAAPGAG